MKRFYQSVATAPEADGFEVRLDGRPLRTPARRPLRVPSEALAEAIAAEWRQQGETIAPETMPLTRLANTAIDLDTAKRAAMIDAIAAYGETDLLCYRAEQPAELAARQARLWQPILDWVALRHDAALLVGSGVMPVDQPAGACNALRAAAAGLDLWRFIALQSAVASAGSLVLALALVDGRITGAEAFELSQLDETHQIDLWGEDHETAHRRRALRADLMAAEALVRSLP